MKLTSFKEYINLLSHNGYLNREIHVICGEQTTNRPCKASVH